jgi:hypothetical protein
VGEDEWLGGDVTVFVETFHFVVIVETFVRCLRVELHVSGPGPRSILWTGFNGGEEGFGVAFETAREWRMKKGGL